MAGLSLALALGLAGGPSALAAQPADPAAPPRTLIQKLRSFLGLNPPVAVGGSRGGSQQQVCLLSPWPGQPIGMPAPVLLAGSPLNELRLEQGGLLLWQQRARSNQPIDGPLAWPIRPLVPGETITLRLRPVGASGADFASYTLRVADAAALQANQTLVTTLGNNPQAWARTLNTLPPDQAARAAALLSSPAAPRALLQTLSCTQP